MTRTVASVVVGAIFVSAIWSVSGSAADKGSADIPQVDFHGKIVVLFVESSNVLQNEGTTEYLDDPVIQQVGGRVFITGAAHAAKENTDGSEEDWREGSQVGIAWDKVQLYYVYTPQQFEKAERILAAKNQ